MSRKGEASTLIFMLGSAVFVAAIVVVGLVFYFGSSGTYLLSNVLASPKSLAEHEVKLDFVHIDLNGKGWNRYPVSLKSYTAFYDKVSSTRSIPNVTDEMIEQFHQTQSSSLTLYVQESGLYQQVDFLPGDLFRLMLPPKVDGSKSEEEWVYFHKGSIYTDITKLFVPPPQ